MNEHGTGPPGSNSKEIIRKLGYLFIISAPSGGGKTTLSRVMLSLFGDILYSISYTTRAPREGEQDGVDYYFIPKADFIKRIESDLWAEWAKVHGNYYGTSVDLLNKGLDSGRDMLLEIDVQGTIQILERYPESVTIFIMPPSLEVLRKRLEIRGTESLKALEKRLLNAKKEIAQKDLYRYVIVNDKLSITIENLVSIIEKYRSAKYS